MLLFTLIITAPLRFYDASFAIRQGSPAVIVIALRLYFAVIRLLITPRLMPFMLY